MSPIRILLVDDHALFREGLAGILASQPDMQVVGEAGDGLEAVVKARELKPDLVLMDIQMPGMDGLDALSEINREMPEARVIMLTVRAEDDRLFQAIKNGAQGFLLKNIRSRELLEMLRGVIKGEAAIPSVLAARVLEEFRRISQQVPPDLDEETALTQREQDVLTRVAHGATDKEIAESLSLSIYTVKSHMRSILAKLQVNSRREAARLAKRKGLV